MLTSKGEWHKPILLSIFDDAAVGIFNNAAPFLRHAQWYQTGNPENVVDCLMQAFMKHDLPAGGLSGNWRAMAAKEITEGLDRLRIQHRSELSPDPWLSMNQHLFFRALENRIRTARADSPDVSLALLNQWTEGLIRDAFSFDKEDRVVRIIPPGFTCPDSNALKLAFTRTERHLLRKSDGTVKISDRRFDVPDRYRHMKAVTVRYASWDLSFVHLVDRDTGAVLCRLFPQDRGAIRSGMPRSIEHPGN